MLLACGESVGSDPGANVRDPDATTADTPLAIVGVNVVPMTSNAVLPDRTIVIRDGVIQSIEPSASASVPEGAVVVEGAGRYVIPALIDMHVHLRSAELDAYVAAGIGTVRNMWGFSVLPAWMRDIESGVRSGPRVVSASPGLDGTPPQWPETVIVTDPNAARAAVLAQVDAGWTYLKSYARLSPAAFDSIMSVARAAGIPVIGHVPLAVDLRHAIDEGMRSIEHFTGYDRAVSRTGRGGTFGWADADPSRFGSLIDTTVRAEVWNCPTLTIYATLARRQHSASDANRIVANRRRFVLELARAGGRLLVGTDAGIDVVPAGTSIHDELEEFVAAGLTPFQALEGATTNAAKFLDREDIGRVTVGANADLVLLRSNPLANIRVTREIDGVILRGAWRPL
ncbi:MAG TPA: amidohydrolase family protein [Gemmatimonadaceae bacterium]|jgi:imidazolonepropionase-like amidohydrolase|nr:amidohydrolase family protein [Gemmatimonadaceae bacterium]